VTAFPELDAHDLDGRVLVLPKDLPDGPNVLVLGFQRWHQEQMEAWTAAVGALSAQGDPIRVWDVAAMSRQYRPARVRIDGGTAAGSPHAGHSSTLTVYTDIRALLTALSLPGADDAAVLLLDAEGSVVWSTSGDAKGADVEALASALGDLGAAS
jgi:hypothetical protein